MRSSNVHVIVRRAELVTLSNLVCLGVLLLGSVADAAHALTFRATGVIDELTDPDALLPGRLTLGDPFVAYLTYDPTNPPPPGPGGRTYEWNPSGSDFALSIAVASISAASDPAGIAWINLFDTSPPGSAPDLFQAGTRNVQATGASLFAIELLLQDSTQTAFSSANLPASLDLADFDDDWVGLTFLESGKLAVALGDIQTLTLIPEPGTATLVFVGLAGMALRSARRSR
jgi:hypothetical protein